MKLGIKILIIFLVFNLLSVFLLYDCGRGDEYCYGMEGFGIMMINLAAFIFSIIIIIEGIIRKKIIRLEGEEAANKTRRWFFLCIILSGLLIPVSIVINNPIGFLIAIPLTLIGFSYLIIKTILLKRRNR